MSGMIETYRGAVYPWHCDHMGHMNVMWYVGKFDEATWNLFAHLGLTAAFLRATADCAAPRRVLQISSGAGRTGAPWRCACRAP